MNTAAAKTHSDDAHVDDAPVADPMINDAYLIGGEFPAEMEALLAKPATFLTGSLYGARDKRNTQDGDWQAVSAPWASWINGSDKTKHSPASGFSRHPVGKFKEGTCLVLGSSMEGARRAKAMDEMFAIGLDIDSGTSLDVVQDKIAELGLMCLVYTTFNHGKSGLHLNRDEALRKLGIKTDPTLSQIKEFLTLHSKSRYDQDFIAGITIREAKKQVKDGVVIELDTPALEKFRLIFPLETPVKLVNTAETHEEALALWEDKVTGLAVQLLDVHFDVSCTDPSRLFYSGRHPKDATDWYCAVVVGKPLRYDDIPTYKKAAYAAKREKLNPFELAGGAGDNLGEVGKYTFPSGKSLNEWHTIYKSRFMISDFLETYCPDKIRDAGSEKQGLVHVECPFESYHTSEGGTGTCVINALDSSSGFWVWKCQHDACVGRHKLEFLEEALRSGWVDEDLLWDEDGGFILPPEDEPEEAEATSNVVPFPGGRKGRSTEPKPHPSYDISDPLGDNLRDAWATLDQRYAFVNHGGKPMYFRRLDPHATEPARVAETFTQKALEDWHANRCVTLKGGDVENPAKSFLTNAKRYSGVTFAPEPQICPPSTYNLWGGFAIERQPNADASKVQIIEDFLRDVICSGRQDVYEWLTLWMAHTVQRPGEKPQTALVIQGEGGCGKSTLGEMLHKMCQPFSVLASDPEHVTGRFNSHQATAVMLVSDEALYAGDPGVSSIIKAQVTGRTARIEPKGIDSFEVRSCTRYVYIGNPKKVVPVELNG